MIIDIDTSACVVTKKAESPAEVSRLRREATVLSDARHPGVVELIGQEKSGVLRLGQIDGGCLASWLVDSSRRRTATDIMALGAEVATTIADLHDLGIIHGRLTARHVLIAPDQRPILCSLGHAASGPEDDVAALGRLLHESRSGVVVSDHLALDQAIGAATHPDPRRRPTARAFARTLARSLTEVSPPRRPAATRVGAAGIVAMVLAGALWLRPASTGPPRTVFATSEGRFQVSEPDDPVVAGRWTCGTALPALLRPPTGEVWVWDSWPRGRQPLIGRLAARVTGATSLRAVAASPGCDTLVITRRAGRPVVIDPSIRSEASD